MKNPNLIGVVEQEGIECCSVDDGATRGQMEDNVIRLIERMW